MTDSLILAGGKSTRYKSDKALAHFNDVIIPNVKYTADLTLPFVDNCFVSTNKTNNGAINELLDHKITVIPDVYPMIDCGPMSALWAYFQATQTTNADLLVIATDYIIKSDAIKFLNENDGYIKIKQVPYYTCCHLKINIDILMKYVNLKSYRWRSLLNDANCQAQDYGGYLKNINYPEDLK
ncbi:NTP transferase domain-containing protein [Companilactobacillus allii]|uniref:MobA-like NTP transferase domain-containing protein n=1 Tax=Companilactobacillus allii TaxID=1847728 RepID=A0A1P8Q473_9LACO|nr:NTP transferase domain-containing protein [Companilactobacillus allii]APX72661.1 hypothetical protein BTM29_08905 [Companilactobacillus allii]USQ69765.1 NTP transferase domain-containing protein [Companilactobacillus allii]